MPHQHDNMLHIFISTTAMLKLVKCKNPKSNKFVIRNNSSAEMIHSGFKPGMQQRDSVLEF